VVVAKLDRLSRDVAFISTLMVRRVRDRHTPRRRTIVLVGTRATEPLIRRARIRIVAAHSRVVAVRVLGAIPSRVVARVTVTETVTEVVAKKNAAEANYGAASESPELPIEARIEVPTCEASANAEVAACKRMPSAGVASTTPTPAAFVCACSHG
jgi:hypothetical protein